VVRSSAASDVYKRQPLDGLVGVLIKFFLGFGDIGRIREPTR
jgi:hypothetical protein